MADEIRNDELLQAIADMRETYKKTHESGSDDHTAINEANTKVINLTLHSNFLVPAVISKNTQLVQDKDNHLKFEDKPQARFMLVKHSQNGTFLPVFTDSEEFEKVPHDAEFQLVNMKFSDVATLTEQTPTINGFVINPMTTNLPYTKEMLAGIKQTLIEARDRKLKEQQAAAAPNITVTSGENK